MAELKRVTGPNLNVKNSNPGSIVMAIGEVTLDGSNPTPVDCSAVHGMSAVLGAVACIKGTAALALDPSQITVNYTGSTLNIYAWKVTGAGDATLIASTNSAQVISYVVWGTV